MVKKVKPSAIKRISSGTLLILVTKKAVDAVRALKRAWVLVTLHLE